MLAAYLGDETSAAGYRLAGLAVHTPAPGTETEALAQARAQARLVLVSAAVARRIDALAQCAALAAPSPLVLIVPDLIGELPAPELAARLRAQLGMDA